MKPFLVDVPVKINIWIRPECQRKQFEVIKKVRPSILFVTSDGGRNPAEWKKIKANRKIYDEEIDWDCTVYKLYMDHNCGMYEMGERRAELIWNKVDRCIFLEDDDIPSESFFRFCAELLDKYKDDYRIYSISGLNYFGEYDRTDNDYFFSGEACIWGIAYWKRSYIQRLTPIPEDNSYELECIKDVASHEKKGYEKIVQGYSTNRYYKGHIASDEFYKNYTRFSEHQLSIIPKYNLISNVGYGEDGAHTDKFSQLPKSVQRIYQLPTYELSFPLKHPRHIVADLKYDRYVNKVLCWNHPVLLFCRRIEHAFRCLVHGDIKRIFHGIMNLFKVRHER